MINNSYYDDLTLVKETLDRVDNVKESNEILLESFNNLSTAYRKFHKVADESSPVDEIFNKSYKELTQAYIAFESIASHIDPKCRLVCNERTKVTRLSYVLLDDRSKLIRSQLFVGGEVPAEYLKDITRLWKESSELSFCMDREDKDILRDIEQFVGKLF